MDEVEMLRDRITELDEDNLALLTEVESLRTIKERAQAVIDDGGPVDVMIARLILYGKP